jgi:hypothetical protein
MAVTGIVLSVFGLGFFCWLLFTLAVYALPFLAGLTAGLAAFHSGSGFIGAFVVGLLVGVTIVVLGQIVFATVRTPLIRLLIGLIYAVPATVAGYQLCFALAGIGVPAVRLATRLRRRWRCCCWPDCFRAHGTVYPAVGWAGPCGRHGAFSCRLAVARPARVMVLAVLVIGQIGEDRCGEARIVGLGER